MERRCRKNQLYSSSLLAPSFGQGRPFLAAYRVSEISFLASFNISRIRARRSQSAFV